MIMQDYIFCSSYHHALKETPFYLLRLTVLFAWSVKSPQDSFGKQYVRMVVGSGNWELRKVKLKQNPRLSDIFFVITLSHVRRLNEEKGEKKESEIGMGNRGKHFNFGPLFSPLS